MPWFFIFAIVALRALTASVALASSYLPTVQRVMLRVLSRAGGETLALLPLLIGAAALGDGIALQRC
jgi:hypothetical protein